MKSILRAALAVCVLIAVLAVGTSVLIPRGYGLSEFTPRQGVRYWEMPEGGRIGYVKIARNSDVPKSPIVYIHGGPGGAVRDAQIAALMPLASQGHDLYFYDQIGSGHSDRLQEVNGYSIARHRADLHAVLERIGAPKVILIGHSWGAVLAANYLQNYPTDQIEKVIFEVPGPILPIDASRRDEQPDPRLGLEAPKYTNKEANLRAGTWRARFVKAGAYILGLKLASDHEMDQFMARLDRELYQATTCKPLSNELPKMGPGYYAHVMTVRSFEGVPDLREELSRVELPVLVLKAQYDNQPWGYAAEYLSLFKNSTLALVSQSGHDMATDQPASYLDCIARFLTEPHSEVLQF